MGRVTKVFGILFLFVAFDWLIAIAPFTACAVAAVIAIAWCVFLDRDPRISAVRS